MRQGGLVPIKCASDGCGTLTVAQARFKLVFCARHWNAVTRKWEPTRGNIDGRKAPPMAVRAAQRWGKKRIVRFIAQKGDFWSGKPRVAFPLVLSVSPQL